MTKNMTRKGLALGAASALLISGFTALPASSAGLADTSFVSLAPTSGTEYGMQAADGVPFRMTANEAATVSTGNLKFLVTDPAADIVPSSNTTGGLTDVLANGDLLKINLADQLLTFTTANIADGEYLMHVASPISFNAGGDADTLQEAVSKDTLINVYVDADQVTFKSQVTLAAGIDTAAGGNVTATFVGTGSMVTDTDSLAAGTSEIGTFVHGADTASITTVGVADGEYFITAQTVLKFDDSNTTAPIVVMAAGSTQKVTVASNAFVITSENDFDASIDEIDAVTVLSFIKVDSIVSPRSTVDNSYVIDSKVSDASTNEVLELVAGSDTSTSATVQAWMDANGNNVIDSTEYASPVRTVTWTKPSELVSTVSMSPIPGDVSLTASISTTPVLNGEQVLTNDVDFVNAAFTRQGEATVMYGVDTTAIST